MSKRVADKELTDRNWQDEEEEEEAGVFAKAADNVIKQRVIKTAKRRAPASANGDSKAGLFTGFSGFAGFPPAPAPSLNIQPSLTFPKINVTNGDTKQLFTFGAKSTDSETPVEEQKVESTSNNPITVSAGMDKKQSSETSLPKSEADAKPADNDVFLKKLKKLNQSVLKFAKEHVDKNPFVILTTVFSDYEKHLKKIQSDQTVQESSPEFKLSNSAPKEESPTKVDSSSSDEVKVVEPVSETVEPVKPASNPFSFSTSTAATPAFSFGAASTTPKWSFGSSEGNSTGFSFKPTTSAADSTQPSSGGFSFKPSSASNTPGNSLFGKPVGSTSFTGFGGLVGKPADSTEQKEEEKPAEDETPPQPEKVDHVDKEALYHIKCKLFLKSGDSWNEKGLGIANLKECNGKVQLLIRNDTTMGTVILNTLLHENMPVSKSGKNGLLMVVTGEDEKIETYLCRVNKDKVEEFYDKLTEYKKGAPSATE